MFDVYALYILFLSSLL